MNLKTKLQITQGISHRNTIPKVHFISFLVLFREFPRFMNIISRNHAQFRNIRPNEGSIWVLIFSLFRNIIYLEQSCAKPEFRDVKLVAGLNGDFTNPHGIDPSRPSLHLKLGVVNSRFVVQEQTRKVRSNSFPIEP